MENINLSMTNELKEIFNSAYEKTRKDGRLVITLSSVLYEIFDRYISGQGVNDVLKKYIDGLKSTTKKVILKNLAVFASSDVVGGSEVSDIPEGIKKEGIGESLVFDNNLSDITDYIKSYLDSYPKTQVNTTFFLISSYLSLVIGKEDDTEIPEVFGDLAEDGFDFLDLMKNYTDRYGIKFNKDEKSQQSPTTPDEFINGLLQNGEEQLKEKTISAGSTQQEREAIMRKNAKEFDNFGIHEDIAGKPLDKNSNTPYLDQFSFDMTQADREGKYDPVVGRESEIDQIEKILCCRIKNNAVLLGNPGVGKTAIIESLVHKINLGEVPDKLKGKRVCSLDLNALVSGTKYRGEYEERLQNIIKEVCGNHDIIVYIDEFHNLVGNGNGSGSGDGANILKPYLARGEFQCIGSTTNEEYRKYIEKDGALKRRFQNVQISEPNFNETIDIIKKIAPKYEKYHHVTYSNEVIKACTEWAGRYITDRFYPDKVIDCIDRAGATASLRAVSDNSEIDQKTEDLEKIKTQKIKLVEKQDFEEASKLMDQEKVIKVDLDKLVKDREKLKESKKFWVPVTVDDVASEVSRISKVPLDKIRSTDHTKIRNMRKVLESKVIGQEEAVDKILISLQRNIMGFRDPEKPIASFLLCGSTGVGKSFISKIVASEFFGSSNSLVRIDCGELSDGKASVSKLTGATPGYVGYDDEPILEQVRRKPFSVLLVDEVDKAIPEVFNIFMNILDEGYCILGNGTKVNFRNTIIIFTGNIGTKELQNYGTGLGFNTAKNKEELHKVDEKIVIKAIKNFFRPEFLNRLTNVIVFNSLTKDDMKKIFNLEFAKTKARIKKQGYKVTVTKKLSEKIIDSCDTKYGARDLSRNITKYIENELSNAIINSDEDNKNITLDWNGEKVEVKFNK